MTTQAAIAELKHAHRIIGKLAKLVRHYGYKEELPPLRTAERQAILDQQKAEVLARPAAKRPSLEHETEKKFAKEMMRKGCALNASKRDMTAAQRRACDELVAEGYARLTAPVGWAQSGSYVATEKLKRPKRRFA